MWLALSILSYILGLALIAFVIMQRKDPVATLAWILVIVFIPILGILLYAWFGYGRIAYRVTRRRRSNEKIAEELARVQQALAADRILAANEKPQAPVQQELMTVTETSAAFSVTHGNAIELHTNPEQAYEVLLAAIAQARESIHLQYYIFRSDAAGREVRDALTEAAKRGVAVRLLLDGVGSWMLTSFFFRPLRKAGGHVAWYLPVTIFGRPWQWNLRNHRKITIIDGTIGFTGSANIGNEYRWRHGRASDSYDMFLRCEGPIVQQLQEVFAGDWFFATHENIFSDANFPPLMRRGNTVAQVVESGPAGPTYALYDMLCAAIHAAVRSAKISTPYLIPDQALLVSLRTAALRGVRIEIMLSRNLPTLYERLIYYASRSYYEDLLPYGIHIYEYLPKCLHMKGIAIDDCWLSVGTANMDIRSFFLNFEVNVNIYSSDVSRTFIDGFGEHLSECEEITAATFRDRSYITRILENTMRMFSPIL